MPPAAGVILTSKTYFCDCAFLKKCNSPLSAVRSANDFELWKRKNILPIFMMQTHALKMLAVMQKHFIMVYNILIGDALTCIFAGEA